MPSDRRAVVDSAGREVVVGPRPKRIFPTGNAAAAAAWCLAPDRLAGWPAARAGGTPPIAVPLPSVPAVGPGDVAGAAAAVRAARADLVLDFGNRTAPFVAFADRLQHASGVPTAVVNGRLAQTREGLALLGRLFGDPARAAALAGEWERTWRVVSAVRPAAGAGPRVHYAIGPRGEKTARRGSIHVECLDMLGAVNVADVDTGEGGRVAVDPAAVVAADPDFVITISPEFHAAAATLEPWADLAAVRAGRIRLAPAPVLSWFDFPPSLNRIIGLRWLARTFYGGEADREFAAAARAFHTLFFGVSLPSGFAAS